MDDIYDRYPVNQPFQIRAFRSLLEHKWDGNYLFSGETHNFWEVTCVLEGETEYVRGTKVYILKPGNLICCPPMVFHSSRSLGSGCHDLDFSFEISGALPAILSEGVFYLSPAEINELTGIIQRLCKAYVGEVTDGELGAEATNALTSFVLRLAKQHKSHNKLSTSHSGVLFQRIVESMHSKLYDNITIEQLAAYNGISKTTIKELFRIYAGIGPKKYYSNMRGIEALRLMEEGVEIEQISEMMNYSSASYFSVAFKKQFGVPPGQFRRQHSK